MTGTTTIGPSGGCPVATVTVTASARDTHGTRTADEIAAYLARPRPARPRACCAVADRTSRSGIVI